MPNCFSLTRKSEPEKGPVKLTQIDLEVASFMSVPCHDKYWCYNWYNVIGFGLAMGKTFADLREKEIKEPDEYSENMIKIIDFLDANFTADAWVEIGRK